MIPQSPGYRLATSRGGAVHFTGQPVSQELRSEYHFAAVMLAPTQKHRAVRGGDRQQEYTAPVGTIVIHPANVYGRAAWSSIREGVIVALRPEGLAELAVHEFDVTEVVLKPPPSGTVDLGALRIAELLKMELTQRESASELAVDSLVMLFGMHLLRTYTGGNRPPIKGSGGLPASSERRVRKFLAENFTRKLSTADLAAICGLSSFHFIRAFTKTFGQPPHQYILDLRLTLAEKLLLEDNMAIAEIAYLCGFSSQSHLTASMKTHRGRTPAEMRLR